MFGCGVSLLATTSETGHQRKLPKLLDPGQGAEDAALDILERRLLSIGQRRNGPSLQAGGGARMLVPQSPTRMQPKATRRRTLVTTVHDSPPCHEANSDLETAISWGSPSVNLPVALPTDMVNLAPVEVCCL